MSNLPKFLLALALTAASAHLVAQSSPPVSEPPQPSLASGQPSSPVPEQSPSPAAEQPSRPVFEQPPVPEQASSPLPASAISPQAALVGVYVGDLPCADCSGQRWRLALEADQRYHLRLIYLDRGVAELSGRWRLGEDGKVYLKDDDTENIILQVGENRLRLLDQEGQPIVSSFNYDLERQPDDMPLQGADWQLLRLGNQAFDTPNNVRLRLEAEDRFSGFGGCNRIMGAYRLADNRLEFSRIVGTKMICLSDNSMVLETALLKALMQVRRWEIQGRRLYLRNVAEEILLELEAVEPSAATAETQEAPQENPQEKPDSEAAQ
jgi:heat shock protein HslJ